MAPRASSFRVREMFAFDQLLAALAAKTPDARADFVGHLVFNLIDEMDVDLLPADMRSALERFIDRVGFDQDDTADQTRQRVTAHFLTHAVDADLLRRFDALEAAIEDGDTDANNALGRAASHVLGAPASLKPVGADGRAAGTIRGGLSGLLAARTQAATTPVTRTVIPTTNQSKTQPKNGFSR